MKTISLIALALMCVACGSSGSGGSSTSTSTGTGGDVSTTLLGSGNGKAALYVKSSGVSSPSLNAKSVGTPKTVSYGGGTITTFNITISNIILNNENGSTVTIAVNDTINLADPSYDDYINFLTSQDVAAGNYSGVSVQLGTVDIVTSGITPDPTTTIEAFSNTTIAVNTAFSITTDGDLAIPLVLDVNTILADGFGMSMATPFAIRVSLLPRTTSGYIWTTGDMIGLANNGNLYAISDTSMATSIGTYTETSSTAGTYVFTSGTYIGIRGNYEITQGGSFMGDNNGYFSLNGDYTGGYWVENNGLYGTFTLTNGWIASGTGTFAATNSTDQGTITLNSGATGGAWTGTGDTDASGTFTLE